MNRKYTLAAGLAFALCVLTLAVSQVRAKAENHDRTRTPVLVELFTSEGCSSCPPADALLEKLDRSNSIPGAEAIVLSEHVDYWNHLGWSDPFSSAKYSDRQRAYAERFGLNGVYTPQMVVNGESQFVGSDAAGARAAIASAAKTPGVGIQISSLPGELPGRLRVRINVEPLPPSSLIVPADVFFAVAENEAFSTVTAGENGGRRLRHVAVLRALTLIGTAVAGEPFQADIPLKLAPGTAAGSLRLIAFVQQRGQRAVLGAILRESASSEAARQASPAP